MERQASALSVLETALSVMVMGQCWAFTQSESAYRQEIEEQMMAEW